MGFDIRKLIDARDIGDILNLIRSGQKLMARRSKKAAHKFEHNAKETEGHIIEDLALFGNSVRAIVDRKSREFSKTRKETAKQINKNVKHFEHDLKPRLEHFESSVEDSANKFRDSVEASASKVRGSVEKSADKVRSNVERSADKVRDNVETSAARVRETVDQKTYETAKKIVDSHEKRQAKEEGEFNIFMVGAVLGTLVGAVLAFWYAPQSGEQTRQEIEQAAQDAIHKVEGESIEESLQAGRDEARRFQQTGVR